MKLVFLSIGVLIVAAALLVQCSPHPAPLPPVINVPHNLPLTDEQKELQQEARARFNVSARECKQLADHASRDACHEEAISSYDAALRRAGLR